MSKISASLFFCCYFVTYFYAQELKSTDVYYNKCKSFGISEPLKELVKTHPINPNNQKKAHKRNTRIPLKNQHTSFIADPLIQKQQGSKQIASTLANWQGLGNISDGIGGPYDPSGAAGSNHFVQAINFSYRVYDKSGNPLMAELALESIWPGSTSYGDPVVLYDKFADRWLISQIQVDTREIMLAVSTSPDPTGTFYKYIFIPSGIDFVDYPRLSIWTDGYYLTYNAQDKKIVVLDRNKMIAGDTTAGMIVKSIPSFPDNGFFSPLGSDADGQLPPNGTPSYFFVMEDDSWGNADRIHIISMTTDWNNPSNTSITLDTLETAPFNSHFSFTYQDIPQKNESQLLDGVTGAFMQRAQYRIWTGYNSVLLCSTVNVAQPDSTNHAGIRWYELRQNSTTGEWSIYQQGTFAPDSESRWIGSMAMDDDGNIGIAYSISGLNTYPSIGYTGRLASDPLGVFTFNEQIAIAGQSSQPFIERWGDYSQTSLDPDGHTFWHTGMYRDANKTRTRIFSFDMTSFSSIKENKSTVNLTVFQLNDVLKIEANQLSGANTVSIDLFDMSGKLITHKTALPIGDKISEKIGVQELSKGTYLVRIGNSSFQKVVKTLIY
ncbi:MAG: T9SS type A sorting domain-containing protein [Bacteroidia bacterium]